MFSIKNVHHFLLNMMETILTFCSFHHFFFYKGIYIGLWLVLKFWMELSDQSEIIYSFNWRLKLCLGFIRNVNLREVFLLSVYKCMWQGEITQNVYFWRVCNSVYNKGILSFIVGNLTVMNIFCRVIIFCRSLSV